MKILITGGAGYIGSMLVERLLNYNHKIYIVDLCIYDTKLDLCKKNIVLYKKDIRYFNWKIILEQGIDVVYHLAGISNDPGYGVTDEIGRSINYDATIRLYNECIKYKVSKFIYPSSCSVYGRQINIQEILTESSPVAPLTNYGKIKIQVEKYIQDNDEINYIILRPATVYGYSYRQRFDLIINLYISYIYNNRDVIVSNKENIRPFIYIDDLIDIYIKLLDNSSAWKEIYNIAGNNYSLVKSFDIIKTILKSKSRLISENNMDSRSYQVSSEKLFKIFPNYQFTSFEQGINSLINKFKEGVFDDYDINSNYYGKLRQPLFFVGDNK